MRHIKVGMLEQSVELLVVLMINPSTLPAGVTYFIK